MSYLEREGFVDSRSVSRCESKDVRPESARPKLPSLRFTLVALFASVASAGLLGFGLVVFAA
ncbi:MAG: hypothetical protein RLN60_05645 [Phycisphaerales bacterium]